MTRTLKALAAALILALAPLPALAQQVAAHGIPIGKGPGVVGFGVATAGAAGTVLLGKGTTTDPAFTALGGDVSSVNSSGSVTLDGEIHCLAALTSAADKIAYYTGSGTCALADLSSAERTYLTTSSSANLRGVLTDEVGTGAAYFVGGALGTPTSGTGTNLTGIPIATGVAGSSADLRTALSDETGTGLAYFQGGALGTPASGVATNLTGTASGLTAGTVTTNANLTGVITSSGNATSIASQTGTGTKFVVDTGPTLTGAVTVAQSILLTGDISPTQIVANTNDYAPTGFSTATTLRLNTDASRNITGLAGGTGGRVIVIHNVGSFNIVLTNQDAASTAANRFLFGGDVTLAADTSITLRYDTTSSRWRATTSPGAGGGGGGGVTGVTIAAGTGIAVGGTCAITTSGTCTVSLSTPVAEASGGTNQTTYAQGDILYASASNTLSKLAKGTDGSSLAMTATVPGWGSSVATATVVATTSGTSKLITGIPSYAREITVGFSGVSTNGSSVPIIQIGPSGGVATTGYLGGAATIPAGTPVTVNATTGFAVTGSMGGTVVFHGTMVLTLVDASTNTWVESVSLGRSDGASMIVGGGSVSLSGTLDRLNFTTTNGTDAFDAGKFNVLWR